MSYEAKRITIDEDIESISPYDLDGGIDEAIDLLKNIRDDYTEKGWRNISLDFDHNGWDGSTLTISGTRDETDKEYNARIKKEKAAREKAKKEREAAKKEREEFAKKKEINEKRELKRLLKKHGIPEDA